jgi:signal transduction histidine kinase
MNVAVSRASWSLRSRLLALLVILSTGLLTGSATLFYMDARDASQQLFDDALKESGNLILQLAQHEVEEHGLALGVQLLHAETRAGPFEFRYQIWTDDMRSAYRSTSLPATPLMSIGAQGFDWAIVRGEKWRAYATWNATHTLQIQIVQSLKHRQALARNTLTRLVTATVLLLLLTVAVTAWIINRTVRPLRDTALSVALRSPDDLRLVDEAGAPSEVRPLLTALNHLLVRVRDALRAERRFTADAAHELRTPLAAIRTNAQVLLGARNEQEKASTAEDLMTSVDRGTRLIEQLLALARADAQGDGGARYSSVPLAELLHAQLAEHVTLAARREVALAAELQPLVIQAVPTLLTVMVRNLIDNAIRYTPAGGTVTVRCLQDAQGPQLSVVDTGPGIPETERERIFERFYRLAENGEPGSGLGLSIVQRIAELHGATIAISAGSGDQGTCITVHFRPAETAID